MVQGKKQLNSKPKFAEVVIGDNEANEMRESALPSSLLRLVCEYATVGNITEKTEYILFEMDGTKYILWIKYGISSKDIKQFQIRSFYKCTEQRDIIKFEGLTNTHIRENLYAYVNKK